MDKQLKKTLLSMANEIEENISHVNRGGCGFVAYYTAKYFKFNTIVALASWDLGEELLKNYATGKATTADHLLVKVDKGKYFDSTGIFTYKHITKGVSHKRIQQKAILNKSNRYLNTNNFMIYIKDFTPVYNGIQHPGLWNQYFNRAQIPKLKRIIKKYAKQYFNETA
jgi:hypothetical protein